MPLQGSAKRPFSVAWGRSKGFVAKRFKSEKDRRRTKRSEKPKKSGAKRSEARPKGCGATKPMTKCGSKAERKGRQHLENIC